MVKKEQLEKINTLLDKHNNEVEIEGCIIGHYYDILAIKRKNDKLLVVADDMEECDIVELPIYTFSRTDIDNMIQYVIDYKIF